MELQTLAKNIQAAEMAACPEDVFGGSTDGETIGSVYKQLIAVIHPDHFVDSPKEYALANEVFTALTNLKGAADRKVKAGTYGDKNVKAEPAKKPFSPIVLEARGRRHTLTQQLGSGDLTELYTGYVGDNLLDQWVFKVTRDGANNDLADRESKALQKLFESTSERDQRFQRFFPRLHDSFVVAGPGYQRRVNMVQPFLGHRGLDEVLRVFPDGIDFRDMIWMFKRILHGLGYAHEKQLIHGAILPPHIMIGLEDHGAKIIDWSYSVDLAPPATPKAKPRKGYGLYDMLKHDEFGTHPRVPAISNDYRDYYAPEILGRQTPTPAADIYMAARIAMALIGGDLKKSVVPTGVLPEAVAEFFERCMDRLPNKRPQNAWDAHQELDGILMKAVGKRKWRPFPMPKRG
jgi:serine/threonine protein kinase